MVFKKMPPGLLISCSIVLAVAGGSAQSPAANVRVDANIHGRAGWVLENGKIRVSLLRGGGHIAGVRLLTDNPRLGIDPMYVPSGDGYVGHLVCFPHFGPASPEERAAGLRGHGEAGSVDWDQTRPTLTTAEGITFFYGAELPKTQYRIERAVSLKAGAASVHVEEWIENLAAYDRPYNRDQHATFGVPFVAAGKSVLDMSGTRGMTDPKRTAGGKWVENHLFQWPDAPRSDGSSVSLREFAAVPGGQVYTPVLTNRAGAESWFTLFNTDYPLLVGYIFPTADHPWIIDWQNQPRAETTAGMARGIEFGTSPFDEGLRKSVDRGQLLGAPTYRFIGAKQRLSTTFTMFLSQVPAGFAGTQAVRTQDGRIVITERGTGRELPGN
jgi:hypothetical protein